MIRDAALLTPRAAQLLVAFGALFLVAVTLADEDVDPKDPTDPLWVAAREAYLEGNKETGHRHLKSLINKHPGDVDLAMRCLEQILRTAGRHNQEDPWTQFAVRRLAALERIGAISAKSIGARRILTASVELAVREGHLFEAVDRLDHTARANPHEIYWKIKRAETYRQLDSTQTRALYSELRREMDLDHPDAPTRDQWRRIAPELEGDVGRLPSSIQPLPVGSPLTLMEPDDPDGLWHQVADRSPHDIPGIVDRVAARALTPDQVVLWRDMSGITDPARALDLHLASRPAAELRRLRKLQDDRFAAMRLSSNPTTAEILAAFRRFPWSLGAQKLLLGEAHRALWDGEAQSALRSFEEVLNHSVDSAVVEAAQVGYWTALSQTGDFDRLDAALQGVDAEKKFPWMGERATAGAIREQLAAIRRDAADTQLDSPDSPDSRNSPRLRDLQLYVIHIPPVSPWPPGSPGGTAAVDVQVDGKELLVSARNLLALYSAADPAEPHWARLERHPAAENRHRGYRPGYFRPTLDERVIYSRWGLASAPGSIAAFDRATGQPLWSNDEDLARRDSRGQRVHYVPMGDPVLVGERLYYLQWSAVNNIDHNRDRRLDIVCYDPHRRRTVFQSPITIAGRTTDIIGNFERASPEAAIYGNRVTLHQGAIYSNSNAGVVARSDARDGRTEWVYFYRRRGGSGGNLGSAPFVVRDKVICLPRDTGRIFALDRRTGRLVWDNTLVLAVEALGLFGDTLIVRSDVALTALDVATGKPCWYRPIDTPVRGRGQMIGASIYLAQDAGLRRFSAATGRREEKRAWSLEGERPQSFAIHEKQLYLVTDKPAEDTGEPLNVPLNRAVSRVAGRSVSRLSRPLTLPLERSWRLHRSEAHMIMPPVDSPLAGRAYLSSGGIIECVEVSASGAILWRRLVDFRESSYHFVGNTLLLIEHANRRASSWHNRVVAVDGRDGRVLWNLTVPLRIETAMSCGATQVVHDRNGNVLGFDITTGKLQWQRRLGYGQFDLHWDGMRLHAFCISQERSPYHLVLDPKNGRTVRDLAVEVSPEGGRLVNGRRAKDGYYDISFPQEEARYIRVVALSEINGRGWTSIAELQMVGADGKTISRRDWKVLMVDSYERQARYDTRGETVFDGDPDTWWHSQWIGGIPPHPHEIQIDLGASRPLKGLRYLPAVIINNNGMIRDYELYLSQNGKDWGKSVAKGVMVSRVRIERPLFGAQALYFESRNHQHHTQEVFRYGLDGATARRLHPNARLQAVSGKYVAISGRDDSGEVLTILHGDKPGWEFEIGPSGEYNHGHGMIIDGERLILAHKRFLIADLEKRQFLVAPDKKSPIHRQGMLVREGANNLFKFVHEGGNGHTVYLFNLATGQRVEAKLKEETDRFQDRRGRGQTSQPAHFNGVLLLYDGVMVSAWTGGS